MIGKKQNRKGNISKKKGKGTKSMNLVEVAKGS